jgi:hypothetical protein
MSTPPELEREDADHVSDEVSNAPSNKAGEFHDVDKKTGDFMDSKGEHEVTEYSSDEFGEGRTAPIETAQDLVSKIIHVEDDKTLNPLTFRTIFLGKSNSTFSRR